MAKKKDTPPSEEAVNMTECAAFEKLKEMQEVAFRQGGMPTVLVCSGAALGAFETMLEVCSEEKADNLTTRNLVAGYLLTEFFPSRIAKLEQMPVEED